MSARAQRSGAQRLAAAIANAGITHAFVVGGHPVDSLIGACGHAGIRLIGARHQTGACLMSVAFNYVSGSVRSVVIVSAGPAASNCATGVLFAHDNRWPLIVLAGRLPSTDAQPGAFQDFDAGAFHAPLLRARAVATGPDAVEAAFELVLAASIAEMPGPTWVDLTLPALTGVTRLDARVPTSTRTPDSLRPGVLDLSSLDEAARCLAQARRPVALVGEDLRWAAPWAPLRRLIEMLRMPFAATPLARGYLPEFHPLDVGACRAAALADADLVLMAGARVDWTVRHGVEFPSGAPLIQIGGARSEHRGIGLGGDEAVALSALVAALDTRLTGTERGVRDERWLERLCAQRVIASRCAARERPGADRTHADARGFGASTDDWMDELAQALPDDAITVLDGSVAMTRAQRRLSARTPVSRLTPGRNGTMGVGVAFAIGAKLACPDRPVVLVSGDFAFGLNAFELETAVRHRVPIVTVVANNRGLNGAQRQRQFLGADFADPVMSFGEGIRHDLLATSFGAHGLRVSCAGELAVAVGEALARDLPTCIDLPVPADEPVLATI
ncbi:MAG: thiamine pyrophosphate-binding protein [Burkholderiaceae bacterium]